MSAAVATELGQLERRAKVVDLAKRGRAYSAIAIELGIGSKATVARDIAAWCAETKPTPEATEELRKLQAEEIRGLREKLWNRLETPAYDHEGNALLHPVTGKMVLEVDVTVVDRLVRLMEREAKLLGLDLERNIQVTQITAEGLAALFWDGQPAAIEGTATEIVEDAP